MKRLEALLQAAVVAGAASAFVIGHGLSGMSAENGKAGAAPASSMAGVEVRGDWQFDEGSGAVADDSSRYRNDGQVYDAAWVAGVQGSALRFEGTDGSYVEVPDKPELSPTRRLVIDVWVNPESYPQGFTCIIYKGDLQPTGWFAERSYSLWAIDGGGLEFNWTPEGEDSQLYYDTPDGLTPTGQWSHVRVELDTSQGTINIFVNGQNVLQDNVPEEPIKVGDSPLRIGGMFQSAFNQSNFAGSIDDVKIYGDALLTPTPYHRRNPTATATSTPTATATVLPASATPGPRPSQLVPAKVMPPATGTGGSARPGHP